VNHSDCRFSKIVVMPSALVSRFKTAFLAIFLLRLAIPASAQEPSGLFTDQTHSIYRGSFNPAFLAISPNCWEFNILTANFGFENNIYFLPRGQLEFADFLLRPVWYLKKFYDNLEVYPNVGLANLRSSIKVQGPSLLFKVRENHTFNISSAFRVVSSANSVPSHLAYLLNEGLSNFSRKDELLQHEKAFSGATASWSEIGLGYALRIKGNSIDDDYGLLAGISLNAIHGYHGIHLRETDIEYLVNLNNDMEVSKMNLVVLSSSPIDFYGSQFNNPGLSGHGRGFSFSLGVVYEVKPTGKSCFGFHRGYNLEADDHTPKLRLGVSLVDVGAIKFDERVWRVEFNDAEFVLPHPNFSDYDSFDHLLSIITDSLTRGEVIITQGDPYWLGLPSALNVSLDYSINPRLSASFFITQDLPIWVNRVQRSSQVGIVPRYNHHEFSFALPVSFHEFSRLSLGAYFRWKFFSVGSDNLGGFFGLNKFSGFDIYFSTSFGLNCPSEKRSFPCDIW